MSEIWNLIVYVWHIIVGAYKLVLGILFLLMVVAGIGAAIENRIAEGRRKREEANKDKGE